MKEFEIIRTKIREKFPVFRDKYKVKTFGVFGSYGKGAQMEDSDVDILVEFYEPIGLLEFVALERQLSGLIGKKVDLVMKSALKPRIGKHILKEVKYI